MKAITFLLHAQQPILATSLQGDPNSDVSHSYIPGSMIRGMLIGRYLNHLTKHHGLQETDDILDSHRFPDVTRLFFDNTVRYLNAYLFDSVKEQRTLPIPLSLYKEKGQELDGDIWDFSQTAINRRPDSPQRLDRGFCLADNSEIIIYQEKRRINIHNQRNRQRGRGNEGSGAVFRYDAIDAGQTFQGVVLCDSEQDAEIIKSLLQPEKETEKINAWLGGSQSAGYGHVTIELLPDDNNWHEVYKDWEDRKKRETNLTVTLLSDIILRNEWGQYTTDPQELVKLLCDEFGLTLKHIDTYASSTIVGGFNRKWGLPLPQVPAILAGSVFVFEIPKFYDESQQETFDEKVKILEAQGVGERRVDGFGCLVLNWLTEESTFSASKYVDSTASNQKGKSLSSESEKIAERMAERLLRQKLDELLLERLEANTPKDSSKISNSQLSRLMIVAAKALAEGKPDPLYELVGRDENSDNLTKTARTQFKQTEMSNGKKLDDQIRDWLNNPESFILSWGAKYIVVNQPGITIASQSKTLDNQLSLEYTLRLIIAVSKKMMKDKNND
jgi:CRISPR-associated protein Csx10